MNYITRRQLLATVATGVLAPLFAPSVFGAEKRPELLRLALSELMKSVTGVAKSHTTYARLHEAGDDAAAKEHYAARQAHLAHARKQALVLAEGVSEKERRAFAQVLATKAHHPELSEALSVMREAVESSDVTPEDKKAAIQILEYSRTAVLGITDLPSALAVLHKTIDHIEAKPFGNPSRNQSACQVLTVLSWVLIFALVAWVITCVAQAVWTSVLGFQRDMQCKRWLRQILYCDFDDEDETHKK